MNVELVHMREVGPELRRHWRELAADATEPNPFFEPATELAECDDQARLLIVWEGAELLLALPVRAGRGIGLLPVPTLVAGHDSRTPLGTPLVRRGDEQRAFDAVLQYLRHRPDGLWLVLMKLPVHGPVAVALQDVLAAHWATGLWQDVAPAPLLAAGQRPDREARGTLLIPPRRGVGPAAARALAVVHRVRAAVIREGSCDA